MFSGVLDFISNTFSSPTVQASDNTGVGNIVGAVSNNAVAALAPRPVALNTPFVIGSTAISPLYLVLGAVAVYFVMKK